MTDSYRTTVTRDEPVTETDPLKLARPVADVIRDEVAAGIRAIPRQANGYQPFNRTGHLVEGLHVEKIGDGFAVMAPSDRLEGERGELLMARLSEIVPVIADPLSSPKVQEAIEASWAMLVGKR